MKKKILALLLSGSSAVAHGHGGHALAQADPDPHAAHHEHMMHHWSAPARDAKRRNPVPASGASLKRGQALYQAHCAACHGDDGAGAGPAARGLDPAPANLREMVNHHSDGDLAWKIANGRGPMPAWKGILKQRQIWDLVNYLKHIEK